MTDASDRLHVKVRLLAEPALWCWEICDRTSRRVVESSWAASWTAYTSREEAGAAGERRLRQLAAGGAPMTPREGHRTLPRAS